MKFPGLKVFSARFPTLESIATYLQSDLAANLQDLSNGLKRLDFTDNFESFQATVTITAGAELAIENKLRGGAVPTRRLILRSDSHEITDGVTAWSSQFVYLKNHGLTSATLTVVFLK